MATAGLLLAVAATALGFLAGAWAASRAAARKRRAAAVAGSGGAAAADSRRRKREELCECGVMLPKSCTPEEKLRHQASNRHRSNMLKLGNASEVVVCEEVVRLMDIYENTLKPEVMVVKSQALKRLLLR